MWIHRDIFVCLSIEKVSLQCLVSSHTIIKKQINSVVDGRASYCLPPLFRYDKDLLQSDRTCEQNIKIARLYPDHFLTVFSFV